MVSASRRLYKPTTVPDDTILASAISSEPNQISVVECNDSSDGFQQQRQRRGHFNTAKRRHHKSFVLSGISTDSDIEGLEDFLHYDMHISYKYVKFLKTSREDCKVAQIVVDDEQADNIMANVYWPPGMNCRPWLQRREYAQRYQHFDDSERNY